MLIIGRVHYLVRQVRYSSCTPQPFIRRFAQYNTHGQIHLLYPLFANRSRTRPFCSQFPIISVHLSHPPLTCLVNDTQTAAQPITTVQKCRSCWPKGHTNISVLTLNHPPTAERVQHIRRSCMHAVYFTDIAGRSEVVTIMPKKIPSTCSNI